ncbi:hypothetical protein OOT00_02960 [Desulfobotulus sp. H1]|uniref:Uncharacterized protein n=1 Tax=Desulfobotulus pelophilus TaxID=2823377 RepID=A0ABT3N671_9BACT|nr:hypothetical protein [Desulfobotulus pelophilus]MCW7752940.1 hypothetical protein [Desulfobotulus pelophilus]
MLRNRLARISRRMRLSLLMLFMTLALVVVYLATRSLPPAEERQEQTITTRQSIDPEQIIDFGALGAEETAAMSQRKQHYGISDSMDMMVTSEESIRVGDTTLSMRDFEEKDALSKGKIVARPLDGGLDQSPVQDYGIHVVRPGDNIWNIHFRLLKEYLGSRGIELPPGADRPTPSGYSSGVGRVLKFSERMVRIYNMKEKNFAEDIHIIQPFEKIIIYNMKEISGLLDSLNGENVNSIRFDGENLWIAAP